MTRKRMAEPEIKSWEEVDLKLAQMADVSRSIDLEKAACNEVVDQIKLESAAKIKPLETQLKALELSIKEFCEHQKASFATVKTKKLLHGSVGYRLSTSVSIPDPAFTLIQLEQLGLIHCIRTKVEPDKDQIRLLDGEVLMQIGANLMSRNSFGYELATVNPSAAVA